MMRYLKILLIRHALSIGNLQGRMEGQMEGAAATGLSPTGRQQAEQLSQTLIEAGSSSLPTHLYSSPLLRAAQTTAVLLTHLQHINHPVQHYLAHDLREVHPGIFQGLTWAEAQIRYPELCGQLLSSLTWQPVPEAESLAATRARASAWVKHILQTHRGGETIWAVSHGGILQQIISVMLGCDRTWKMPIDHTAIFEFWLAATPPSTAQPASWQPLANDQFNPEYWHIRRFNDCSHLHQR
ncbi:MAG: histidine phosphatase family protein [Phormidesmis sp. RL_2_1]|nr:histidine phosphatase family protein [Phormidesmis sp. RL_2_1]